MIGAPKDESRRLIPRWRPLSKTAASGELAQPLLSSGRLATGATAHTPAKRELRTLTSDFAAKLLTWRHDRSIATASELVSAGLVLGVEDEVFHAADFILGLKNNPFPWVTSIADCVRSVNAEPPTGAGLTVLPIDGGTAPTTPDHRRMLETIEISEQRRRLYVDSQRHCMAPDGSELFKSWADTTSPTRLLSGTQLGPGQPICSKVGRSPAGAPS